MAYGIPGYGYGVPQIRPDRDSLGERAMSGSSNTNRYNPQWKKENSFYDQMLHNRLTSESSDIKGAAAMYYCTSLEKDHLVFQEDRMREVERTFEVRIVGEEAMQKDNYQYSRYMIMGMDEFAVYVHRTQFFEHNRINLLENGIMPASAEDINTIWESQRGKVAFVYKGYTSEQIYPKAGDLIKLNFEEALYEINDVSDKVGEDQFMQAKYWFKLHMKPYRDDGRDVSPTLATDTKDQGFIDEKFNNHIDAILQVSQGTKDMKDEVLYRPKFVSPATSGITDQPRAQGPDTFGGW